MEQNQNLQTGDANTILPPLVEEQPLKSMIQFHSKNPLGPTNSEVVFEKTLERAVAEKRVIYLLEVSRVNQEKAQKREAELLAQIKHLKAFNEYQSKAMEDLKAKILKALEIKVL